MEETFDKFNALQFVDFVDGEMYNQECTDQFFDVEHESFEKHYHSDNNSDSLQGSGSGDSRINQSERDPLADSYEEQHAEHTGYILRKSLSVGTLVLFNENAFEDTNIRENVESLSLRGGTKKTDIKLENTKLEKHNPVRKGEPKLRSHESHDRLNELAQPKKFTSTENLHAATSKFVSFAESVNQFQNRTPVRFRSKPDFKKQPCQPLQNTIPHSPALQTKTRHRAIHIPSQEERELEEFRNAQKFKIKAHPVSKKVLQGPVKPTVPVVKKAPTIPVPFAITSVPSRKVMPSPEKFEFHAHPVPKSLHEPPKQKETERKVTKAVTPTFMKGQKKEIVKKTEKQPVNKGPLQLTKIQPFTFEERDKMIQVKRTQLLNKILEEEKRAREFHAKPVPESIYKKKGSMRRDSASSAGSSRTASQETLNFQFKAKPPVVLYKEPFVPEKPAKSCTELVPFFLSTEYRALEREEFKKEQKAKEEQRELLRQLEEERQRQAEQEEIMRLRKAAEYKAQPIKKYKEVEIKPCNKVTQPISPKLHTARLRNKENISNNTGTVKIK